jgi:hypothetical protein
MMERDFRPRRIKTSIAAVMIDSDGGELPVEVIDLSSGGFRLYAGEALVVGELVRLRVPRCDDFPAQIQWVDGHYAGGRFTAPIELPR